MVFSIFLLQTFPNILHFNLCGKYMPTAVWIRVKYRQEDDTLALAVKTGRGCGGEGGGWHMMGDVVPSPVEALVG